MALMFDVGCCLFADNLDAEWQRSERHQFEVLLAKWDTDDGDAEYHAQYEVQCSDVKTP